MGAERPAPIEGSSPSDEFDAQVSGIAALAEPVRRSSYCFVERQPAKFHLDKLVHDGPLECEFRRPPGRGGPGAGRPAKLYRRSSRQLAVSLPARRYERVGRLFATAVADAERKGIPVGVALV